LPLLSLRCPALCEHYPRAARRPSVPIPVPSRSTSNRTGLCIASGAP
jgi:hypothetical protein